MGECLRFQAELRDLRGRLRGEVAARDRRLAVLERAGDLLGQPVDTDAAAHWRGEADRAQAEAAQIQRWLRGDDRPQEPGLTRAMLRLRLDDLAQTQQDASLWAHACALEDPADRAELRRQVQAQTRSIRRSIQATTQPMRERLDEMEQYAAAQGERMEDVMGAMGLTTDRGPVAVMAVATTGFYMHGHVSYRWTDRRGQLVASAQVRLLPRRDTDTTPPLLRDRFPILDLTPQGAQLHVGHFSVDFHINADALESQDQVLETLGRLLDLDTLAQVSPGGDTPGQN